MANAKFSLNLEFSFGEASDGLFGIGGSSSNIFAGGGDSNTYYASSNVYSSNEKIINTLNDNLSDTALPTGKKDGFCIADKNLKVARLGFTAWGSFPVKYTQNGQEYYTICRDAGANKATALGGNMSDVLYQYTALPTPMSNNTGTYLNNLTSSNFANTDLYRVGCAIHNSTGNTYLRYFYPEVKWCSNPFQKLNKAKALIAEITIPTSATTGQTIYLKVVDGGGKDKYRGREYGNIDISGAICALKKYSHLFRPNGLINKDGGKFWRSSGAEFLFADSEYNPMTGNLTNYGPKEVKKLLSDENKFKITTKFKTFTVSSPPANLTKKSYFFVRFYVPSIFREAAEKNLGYKLPDEMIIDAGKVLKSTSKDSGNRIVAATSKSINDSQTEINIDNIGKITMSSNNYSDTEWPGVTNQWTTKSLFTYQLGRDGMVKQAFRGVAKLPEGYPMTFSNTRGDRKMNRTGSDSKVTGIVVNRAIAKRVENAFRDAYNYYTSNNIDMRRQTPGICVLHNTIRSGSKSKMHEIGFAMDIDYHNNKPYGWGWTPAKSRLRQTIYRPFLHILEHHKLTNLGWDSERYKGGHWKNQYGDWMHFQAAIQVNAWNKGIRDSAYDPSKIKKRPQ